MHVEDQGDDDAWRGSPQEQAQKLEVIRKIWCGEITVEEGQDELQRIIGDGYKVEVVQTRERSESGDG